MIHKPHTGSDCKYNQYALLNLSMGYKQNIVVMVNTKIYKGNIKLHIHIPRTCRFIIHICTQIYELNTGQERVL